MTERRVGWTGPDPGQSPEVGPGEGSTASGPAEGVRHLGQIPWHAGEVRALDVWAERFDDGYQEDGAFAAVRDVVAAVEDLAALGPALRDILAPDEHGPFHGAVTAPGPPLAEVRLRHVHAADGEQ